MRYSIQDNRLIFNVSREQENFSQRNNEFKWSHPLNTGLTMQADSMCNVTSVIMALQYAGFKFPSGPYKQPEDNLCKFLFENQEVLDYYKKAMPAMYAQFEKGDSNAYCPNLVHAVLAFGTNKWLGTTALTFKDNIKITDLFKEIVVDNKPVVLSGTFPYKYLSGKIDSIGHINVLVGVVYDVLQLQKYQINVSIPSEIERVLDVIPTHVIIDDPYGNYALNFKADTGNDVVMPFADFIRCYRPCGDVTVKWGHLVSNSAAVV
jgi:hypothetical protein